MPPNPLPLDAAARDELAPDAATPVGEATTMIVNIMLPRDRATALAFLNGMLAMLDAIHSFSDTWTRNHLLAVRQHYFDMPVEP